MKQYIPFFSKNYDMFDYFHMLLSCQQLGVKNRIKCNIHLSVVWFAFDFQKTAVCLGVFRWETEGTSLSGANISIQCVTGETMTLAFEYVIIYIELKMQFRCYILVAYR